ncbi:MAG: conjugal transfer protein TraG N-terminal domain-containing protein [Rickettsiales bacterium]
MEIYTIGNAYFLDKIFNAIKIIFASDLTTVLKVASAISLFLIVSKASVTNDFKTSAKWLFGVAAITGLFLTAKARVVIHDQLPDQNGRIQASYIVDEVPWGLAKLASVTSSVGKDMMDKFESAFSGVTNNSTYRRYGILFGSKIIEDAGRLRVSNSDLRGFINKFYKQCIIPDLKMGHTRKNGYTLSELSKADDIAEFLENHASKARRIFLNGTVTRTVKKQGFLGEILGQTEDQTSTLDGYVTCNTAASYISDMIDSELSHNKSKISSSFVSQFLGGGHSPQEKNLFYESVLRDTYGAFLKSSKDASEILKQNVMINSLRDASATVSNTYAQIATEEMTKSSFYSVSQVFQKFIPIIRSVFECLFYGVFPIVLILMVTPIGLEVLKNYAFSFVYLQMWTPMYAILYTVMESWSRFSADGLNHTMESLPQIEAINQDISMVSGYMLALIPVLSMFVTKGLVASVGNMATSMMYIPQTAAVQTSDQSVKGNYQFGSTSMDNHSYDTTSAHKHDDNYSWMSGMKNFAMPSGSTYREAANGQKMLDVSSGLSNLGSQVNVNWNKAIGNRFDESEALVQREMESSSRDYIDSTSSGMSKLYGYDKSFSKGTSANEAIERGLSSEQRSAYDYTKGLVERVSKSTGLSHDDSIKLAVGAQAGIGWGKMGASLSADASTNTHVKQAWDMMQDAAKDKKFSESLSTMERIGKNSSIHSSDSQTESLLDSMRSDFSHSTSASIRHSDALEKSRSLQESRSNYENNSSSVDIGLTQQFSQFGMSRFGAGGFEEIVRSNPDKLQELSNEFLTAKYMDVSQHSFKPINPTKLEENKDFVEPVLTNNVSNNNQIDMQREKFNSSLSEEFKNNTSGFEKAMSQRETSISTAEQNMSKKSSQRSDDIEGMTSKSATSSLLGRVTNTNNK